MKLTTSFHSTLTAIALAYALSTTAQAQIGTGWTQYTPSKSIQLRGPGAKYDNTGGIETFTMNSTASGDERSEMRVQNDYSSGEQQFEGDLKPNYGEGTSMHQVFKFVMVVYYPVNGGELRQHSGTVMIQNIKGLWVRINTIHNVATGFCDVYVNGTKKATVDDGAATSWYHKYGVYNAGSAGAQSQWKNVKFFRKTAGSGFSGRYRIMARHSGKAVVVQSASTADGANVFQWGYTADGTTNDEWDIIELGGGYQRVMNAHSGKALVVQGASTADGANVIQWTYTADGTQNDEWKIESLGTGYYRFINRRSGEVLDVTGGGTTDGTNIIQWPWGGGTNQQFQVIKL